MSDTTTLDLTAQIVSAHVQHNPVEPDQVPGLIRSVFDVLSKAGQPVEEPTAKEPVVPVKKSVFNDHLVCLECGGKFKVLKRHVGKEHNLTVEQYRERFGLPRDYPIVAPDYADMRSKLAQELGLGRHGRGKGSRKAAAKRG